MRCSAEKVLGIFTVTFISCLLVYSYYPVVIIMIGSFLMKGGGYIALGILYLLLYHVLIILFASSYYRTIFSDPGFVPLDWQAKGNRINETDKHSDAQVTFCFKCNAPRPPRAHHCKTCGRCVLKMDHHCPWVNNCIGWNNYKFFILLLNYGTLLCACATIMIASYFAVFGFEDFAGNASDNAKVIQLMITGLLAVALTISAGFLCCYHWKLLRSNQTTIENYTKENPFDMGGSANMETVCGQSKLLWLFPIKTFVGDGYFFSENV